jgi:hypothetical protein
VWLDEMYGWTIFAARRRVWLDDMCGWTKCMAGRNLRLDDECGWTKCVDDAEIQVRNIRLCSLNIYRVKDVSYDQPPFFKFKRGNGHVSGDGSALPP